MVSIVMKSSLFCYLPVGEQMEQEKLTFKHFSSVLLR